MSDIRRFLFCEGAVETLGFFSHQIADALQQKGYLTCYLNFEDPDSCLTKLASFVIPEQTVLITFNDIGLSGEDFLKIPDTEYVWDAYDILVVNILVDHPIYYHKVNRHTPSYFLQFCVDEDHVTYMKKYYPNQEKVYYLPLGGTELTGPYLPIQDRPYDLVFAANYVRKEPLLDRLNKIDPEYQDFYWSILDDLKLHRDQPLEPVMKRHIEKELPGLTIDQMSEAMHGMIFIDLYIRSYFRGEVVRTLADAGQQVYVIGKDWDKLPCKHPENLLPLGNGMEDSLYCLRQFQKTKLALNVMPWFKHGFHDRIPNAQLQHAVSLSDGNWGQTLLPTDSGQINYSLDHLSDLPDLVKESLSNPAHLQELADLGYENARKHHTWALRAQLILDQIQAYHH